jgi:hypothetical protein
MQHLPSHTQSTASDGHVSTVEISARRMRGAVSAMHKISVQPDRAVKFRVKGTMLTRRVFRKLWDG